ncbi:hypothetical protein DFJ73DRAFT_917412 [Zopfochytrium polystomum]|nr:hypothetical protein DFJ73DRAFT_917412 [Zopfochytrium polystomum]
MPRVLVTGVTGFIAAHITRELLASGYHVRGTLRSVEKGSYLKSVLPNPENLSFAVVKDLTDDGAFDEAVKDVDYVIHTASPFHFKVQDPYKDLVEPAVKGTTGILQSVLLHGTKVRRVVVTSSSLAIFTDKPALPEGLSEADWNEGAIQLLEKNGANTPPLVSYMASKTLAEKAAWKFMDESSPPFELAVCNPPLVYGPLLQKVTSVDEVNTSCKYIADYLTGAHATVQPVAAGFVDVRDAARAHVLAMTVPDAAGKRFLVSAGIHTHEDLVAVLRRRFPDRKLPPTAQIPAPPNEVNERTVQVLGATFRGLEETVVDTARSLIEKLGV